MEICQMKLNDIKNGLSWFLDETTSQLYKDPVTLPGHPSSAHRNWVYSKKAVREEFQETARAITEAKKLDAQLKKDGWLPLTKRNKLNKLKKEVRRTVNGKQRWLQPKKEAICPYSGKIIKASQLRMKDAKRAMEIFLAAAHESILAEASLVKSKDKNVRKIITHFKKLSFVQRRRYYNELSDFRAGNNQGLTKEQVEFLVNYLGMKVNSSRRKSA